MTTPAGSPAWSHTATSGTYGGHANKHDYQQQGVCNPLTDVSAEQFLRLTEDVAALVRASAFGFMELVCDDTTPDDPTVNFVSQLSGRTIVSYAGDAPPPGFPEATRNSDGNVTIQWPATLDDAYGVAAAPSLLGAIPNRKATITMDDSRTVTVAALNAAGAAEANATIGLWVG